MPPRQRPRRAQPRTNVSRLSPILVPPSQSKAARAARSRASSGRPALHRPGHPGQPGPEAEDLDPPGRPLRRVRELQQAAGVVGHGAGDVQDQDQRPQPDLPPPPVQAGGLAVHAQGFPDGPAGIGTGSGPGGGAAPGPAARRGQPDPGHDPAQRREFFRRAGRERLVLERVDVGGHPAQDGVVLLACLTGFVRRDRQRALRLQRCAQHEHQFRIWALGAEEEPAEHLVVPGDVVMPVHQRGPPRPVQINQVGRVQLAQRRTVDTDVPRAHREPGRAQFTSEADEQASEWGRNGGGDAGNGQGIRRHLW